MALIITSGGLGPTADDLTAEVVGDFAGREMMLDPELEERIFAILQRLRGALAAARRGRAAGGQPQAGDRARGRDDPRAGRDRARARGAAAGRRGSHRARAAGTAERAAADVGDGAGHGRVCGAALAGAGRLEQRILRLYGIPESEIAGTLRAIEDDGVPLERLEITTCLRRGEIEIVTVFEPEADDVYDDFAAGVRARHADTLFSEDGSTVDEQVARLLGRAGRPSPWPSPAPAG